MNPLRGRKHWSPGNDVGARPIRIPGRCLVNLAHDRADIRAVRRPVTMSREGRSAPRPQGPSAVPVAHGLEWPQLAEAIHDAAPACKLEKVLAQLFFVIASFKKVHKSHGRMPCDRCSVRLHHPNF